MSSVYKTYDEESDALADVLSRSGIDDGVFMVKHTHVDEYLVFDRFSDVAECIRGWFEEVRQNVSHVRWADYVSEYNVWMYWRHDDAESVPDALYGLLTGDDSYKAELMGYDEHQAHMASYLGYGARIVKRDVMRYKLDVVVYIGDDSIVARVWSEDEN